MIETARQYFESQRLMDINLISTVGFDDEDIRDIAALDSAVEVMPGYMADLITPQKGKDCVARVFSIPRTTETNEHLINEPILVEGRMPGSEGECVLEKYFSPLSGYKIGDTISFNPSVEDKNTLDYVKRLDYKIVGIIDTPLYLTYLRGNSTVGEGAITFYLMINPEDFAFERYTNVYVRTKASSSGYSDFSDEYKDLVKSEKKEYEDLSEKSIERFNSTTLADAQKKLADAQKEYSDKKKETLDMLSDGSKQIIDGEEEFNKQIADARKKLEDGEKELEEGREKLLQGQKDYTEGIDQAKQKLVDAEKQYSDGLAQYNSGKLEFDTKIREGEKQINDAQREFDTQYQIFYSSTKPQAETKLSLLKTAIDLCNEAIDRAEKRLNEIRSIIDITVEIRDERLDLEKKLGEYRIKLSEYQQQYEEGTKQLEEGEAKLLEGKQKLEDGWNEFYTKKAEGELQLADAKAKLDSARSQIDIGRLEYETAMNTGMLELQAAQAKLTEGEKQLTEGKAELEKQMKLGREKLKKGREEFLSGRYEAHTQLGEAEDKLSDAAKQLESLDNAKWIINTREDNPGYSGLVEDANRVDNVSKVFPMFFLLVAGLVCLTTMTRMVEERRTETGTLKALGYSGASIASKYFIYSGAAALSGSIVGAILGVFTLPYIIVKTYNIMYSLPSPQLVVSWPSFIISSAAGIVCICAVSLAACYKDLKLEPATLMRPKAPKPGKRILLEHIRPVWSHMNFTSKVTARNLFRYKARFFMTVVGVAGCTALIVAAFGLKDSITGIADKQFKGVTQYDQVIALTKAEPAEKKQYLMSQLHADKRLDCAALGYIGWSENYSKGHSQGVSARIYIAEDQEEFRKMFTLRDRVTGEEFTLSDSGIIINERLGDVLGVKAGDTITMKLDDELYNCNIDALTENYAGNYIYMSPEYYKKMTGKEVEYSAVFTHIAEEYRSVESEIAADIMKMDDVMTVSSISEQIATIMDMLDSLNVVIFVMVFCAGLLAVVVLYNLTNINIAERVREIATIKVLGFYNLETANFIYRENIVLTVIGALGGLLMGKMLSDFIVESIQMDNVMFPKGVGVLAYILGFVLTIVFSMLVNFIMYFKMKKISMVESLKSIE